MSSEEKYTFLIEEESKGTRIDRVLSLLLAESSRSYIQKLIEKGKIDTTPLITHRFPLTEIEEAYRIFENKLDGVIKVAIV